MNLMNILENYILFLNAIIKTVIPLSFTIFIFAYREQKDIAYSLLKRKNSFSMIGFISSLALLVIAMIIFVPASGTSISLPKYYVFLICIISIVWIYFSIKIYNIILRSINALKEFKYNLSVINKGMTRVFEIINNDANLKKNEYKSSKKIQKELKRITIAAEINFQILIAKDKFKLSTDFTNSLKLINKTLIEPVIKINNNTDSFNKITPYSGTSYFHLYVLILKNLNHLLEITTKNGQDFEVNMITETFCSIKPFAFSTNTELARNWLIYRHLSQNSLYEHTSLVSLFKGFFDEYFFSVYRLTVSFYEQNDNRFINILGNLIKQEFDNKRFFSENDFLSLTTAIFIRTIEANNLKTLTDITNTYLKYLQEARISTSSNNIKVHNKGIAFKRFNQKRIISFDHLEPKILKIIFLGIIKSIELGHYNCAGFLIKALVKNFNQEKLNRITKYLFTDIKNMQPDLELSKKLTKILPLGLTFSPASYEYCFLKTILLLRLQQEFVTKEKKIISIPPNKLMDLSYFFQDHQINYLNYLLDKVNNLHSTYGLLALQSDFVENIKTTLEKEIS
ncbi:hypothetical protein [Bacillus wiedmannii]|uniref:hypothetical protein n=1 Tax=Bacillus wiedmannii TaxID=1890302 RepID=UPI0007DF2153|nr:hypothetical protein [Bacillus wiedmannii]OAK45032.1 hypothetical protein A6286_24015 [Bacillus wiedmannii]